MPVIGESEGYLAFLHINATDAGGKSLIGLYSNPPNVRIRTKPLTLDPAKAYRLVFTAVGNQLTMDLFELDTLGRPTASVAQVTTPYTRHRRGEAGLWWYYPGSTQMDLTLDNFRVIGTAPTP